MKTMYILKTFLLLAVFNCFAIQLSAQKTGDGNVIKKEIDLAAFDRISVGGALKVILTQAPEQKVVLELDRNLLEDMDLKVVDGELKLSTGSFRKATVLKAEISLPSLSGIEASGATFITTTNQFTGTELYLETSGAAFITFDGSYDKVVTDLSGAGKIKLNGKSSMLDASLSGASKLLAEEFETINASVEASGASNAFVNATENLEIETSGAAKVNHKQNSGDLELDDETGDIGGVNIHEGSSGDTVRVDIGNLNIEVIDGDSTKVKIGNHSLIVDEDGNVKMSKDKKKNKFNGHWAGVEIGVNGLLTPDFNMSYPAGQSYLDLRMEKSLNVNLNVYEQNITLNSAKTIGLVSGLGVSWNNYRFANDVYVSSDSSTFKAFFMDGVSVKKSKLTNMYLTVPLFLEFQTNSEKKSDRLHFALGVVGGWRIVSHTKIYFNEANKNFTLRDPATDTELPYRFTSPNASNRNITKNFDSFNMRPLKLDASVRAGWGKVSIYANYSLFSLWVKDKGPEVYPFAAGICLAGW
ncbi:MAG: hypothetical protein HOO86_16470 [Bacteroidales bacterium]|nr:hypothetical protein [Bacteroidales bacterium]